VPGISIKTTAHSSSDGVGMWLLSSKNMSHIVFAILFAIKIKK
jgi:hypothetical protein